ncbi:hypothetical protein AOLI_G00166110 [Acnodon oligacanthus]
MAAWADKRPRCSTDHYSQNQECRAGAMLLYQTVFFWSRACDWDHCWERYDCSFRTTSVTQVRSLEDRRRRADDLAGAAFESVDQSKSPESDPVVSGLMDFGSTL